MFLDLFPSTATHGKVDVLLVFSVGTDDIGDAITVLSGQVNEIAGVKEIVLDMAFYNWVLSFKMHYIFIFINMNSDK